MRRSASVEIDFNALKHNLSVVRQYSSNAKIVAVIKADAYGHGMLAVADHLMNSVDAFAVACLQEAEYLRNKGVQARLVVLQGFHSEDQLKKCFELNLDPVCHQRWQTDMLSQAINQKPLNVWLKIDTGMHRLGISAAEATSEFQRLSDSDSVNSVYLMSHFANADQPEHASNNQQLMEFNKLEKTLGCEASLSNSAAILSMPDAIKSWVRPGIMLYGASPIANKSAAELGLKPVMKLRSKVIAINPLKAGQPVGYGSEWTSERDCLIAVIAVGYGDGYPRHAQSGTPVLIKEEICPLVGRVSMDMITVDITDMRNPAAIGDDVELWGDMLSVDEVAKSASTIGYELLCNAGRNL